MYNHKSSYLLPLLVVIAILPMACSSDRTASQQKNLTTVTSRATKAEILAPAPTSTPTMTSTSQPTATSTPTSVPSNTPTATASSTLTPTPDPYAGLTIADIATRTYGGGEITVEEVLGVTETFTRSLITYPSDGLTLYGFMNTPKGDGPFPVVLVMHGYVAPERFSTIAYTTRYADALAQAGYLVIHPNYRNWPPSDDGPDSFRVAHALDAMNLAAIIREQAGRPGPLEHVDSDFVGMLGHSMGGGITLRVITAGPEVQAAVLYGSMSGDEIQNFEKILIWSGGERGADELATPPEQLERISPIFHLDRISAAVSIHHGENDGTTPLAWSTDLCQRLQTLQKTVECFTYPGQPHTFQGEQDQLFIQRVIDFFDRQYQN